MIAEGKEILQGHVRWWLKNTPPANRCLAIEAATNGAVTRYELRPDVYGEPPCQAA